MIKRSAISGQRAGTSSCRCRVPWLVPKDKPCRWAHGARLAAARSSRGTRQFRRHGFALVDVIIGGVLLSLGLAAIISLATRSLRTQTGGEKTLTASWLADELLSLAVVDGPVNYPRLHDTHGQFEFPFEDFAYDVELVSQGNDLPYVVTATVSWDDGRRAVQVQTLIAERNEDPNELRAPPEPIDREERWYGEEEQAEGGANASS